MPSGEQSAPIEIDSDEDCEPKRSLASDIEQKGLGKGSKTGLFPGQSTPHEAKQKYHDRSIHNQRKLDTIDVEDMDTDTKYNRRRTLNAINERGGQLTEREREQLAKIEEIRAKDKQRDVSTIAVADMDLKTKKGRRRILKNKLGRGAALSDVEKVQWEQLRLDK